MIRRPTSAPIRRQRGVVLFIALIMLVAMALTGIALSKAVTTGLLIAGNLAFQEGATSSGDAGIEAGRRWLLAQNTATLVSDQPRGYFANWQSTFNPASFDWVGLGQSAGTDSSGNATHYVIHRLCSASNLTVNAPSQQCVMLQTSGASGSKSSGSYGSVPLTGTSGVYYRITARVTGPRRTVSYVQSIQY